MPYIFSHLPFVYNRNTVLSEFTEILTDAKVPAKTAAAVAEKLSAQLNIAYNELERLGRNCYQSDRSYTDEYETPPDHTLYIRERQHDLVKEFEPKVSGIINTYAPKALEAINKLKKDERDLNPVMKIFQREIDRTDVYSVHHQPPMGKGPAYGM